MTTENENVAERTPRTIQELLNLDTYQGMTDEEIQSLIDYYQQVGYDTALGTAQISIWSEAAQKIVDGSEAHHAELLSMVESVVNRPLTMQEVASNE
jgi:hypothetical protein